MSLTFYKYQGTGNDFVFIDNRQEKFNKSDTNYIAKLCDRRFGVGADGLILLENDTTSDFRMVYYNADGNESTMCGNGGRCIVAFAKFLNIIENTTSFNAIDGLHHAKVDGDTIALQMLDVAEVTINDTHVFLNTGSPHHVQFVDNLETFDVKNEGSKIRNGALYGKAGSNINFVKKVSNSNFELRTYERGVEDETLSCGTGATAVAIAMHATKETSQTEINLKVQGGQLKVEFNPTKKGYDNVWLIGEAKQVFKGEITW